MSPTLPPIAPLLQLADAHQPCSVHYPTFGISVGGASSSCLSKRANSPSHELELRHTKRVRTLDVNQNKKRAKPSLLPVDIHNCILETFWDHKDIECSSPETIRACALTCRVWRTAARRHIFRVIILKSWDQLKRLTDLAIHDTNIIGWVQRVRLCGSLPPFDKASSGKPLPPDWGLRDRWIYWFPRALAPRISDRTSKSYQPLNVKIFELFDFSHLSGATEDCQWFAFWIRHLPWLQNVESVYLNSCEMPANAMTAFARSFPRLRRMGLTAADFTAENYSRFHDLLSPTPPVSEEVALKRLAEACARHGVDFDEVMRDYVPINDVVYEVELPPPSLESLYVNHQSSQYASFNLRYLSGWLLPREVATSLRSLEFSPKLQVWSVAEFINNLGPSPTLEHLRLWVGYDIELVKDANFDFSHLNNLKSICFHCGFLESLQVEVLLYILSTLRAPALRKITLALKHHSRFTKVGELDEYLSSKFKNLELVVVECINVAKDEMKEARADLHTIFSQTLHRGLLKVQNFVETFRY